jgi:class 3 adenylate cyclase
MFQELKEALKLYASEHVLDRVLKDGRDSFRPDFRPLQLTLMWANFSILTRAASSPADPASWLKDSLLHLNEHFAVVTQFVHKRGGVIDSIVGESLIAFWGPNGAQDHPTRACRCAMDCAAANSRFLSKQASPEIPAFSLTTSIATGNALAGNVGGGGRIKFTIVGPVVNLASRLSGLTSTSNPIILSGSTQQRLDNTIKTRKLPPVTCKGLQEPLEIFAIDTEPIT